MSEKNKKNTQTTCQTTQSTQVFEKEKGREALWVRTTCHRWTPMQNLLGASPRLSHLLPKNDARSYKVPAAMVDRLRLKIHGLLPPDARCLGITSRAALEVAVQSFLENDG